MRLSLITVVVILGVSAEIGHADEPTRRIVAVSHGATGGADKDLLIMRQILLLTGKKEPRVCLLPTAQGDSNESIVRWYEAMNRLDCRPRHQRAFVGSRSTRSFEDELLAADVIFVGGGNTLNMLAIWKAQGIDTILRKAWEKGIVLAGQSAGGICWFEQGVTDSRPAELSGMDALGFLSGSFAPHYDADKNRRPTYHRLVADGRLKGGYGCDEETALVFEGTKLTRVIAARPNARVYRVRLIDGKVVEEPVAAEYIGPSPDKAKKDGSR